MRHGGDKIDAGFAFSRLLTVSWTRLVRNYWHAQHVWSNHKRHNRMVQPQNKNISKRGPFGRKRAKDLNIGRHEFVDSLVRYAAATKIYTRISQFSRRIAFYPTICPPLRPLQPLHGLIKCRKYYKKKKNHGHDT